MTVVFGSLDQMLSTAGLSGISGAALDCVARTPLQAAHFSGNSLERVTATCDGRPVSFVLKQFTGTGDWISRLTNDVLVREVALYRCGIYECLPGDVWHPALAAARHGQSWALLMNDVSAWMLPTVGAPAVDWRQHVEHLAELHASFWASPTVFRPELGLSALSDFVTIFSPQRINAEVERGHSEPILQRAAAGWEAFSLHAASDVAQLVNDLQMDPSRLVNLLQDMPATLVHGDFKAANIGLLPGPRTAKTILLDWQDATGGPGLLDMAYWLAVNPTLFPSAAKDEALAAYRGSLARSGIVFSDLNWERDLAVCLVAGGALRLLWQMSLRLEQGDPISQFDFDWWQAKVMAAAPYIESDTRSARWPQASATVSRKN